MISAVRAGRAQSGELSKVLEECLSRHSGVDRSIVWLRRTPSAYRTSFPIEDLEIRMDDGTELNLICKSLGRDGLSEEVRLIKPEFLYDPLREIETYEIVLSRSGLGPTFYGYAADVNMNRYWLFLEKIQGVELYQIGELTVWEESARWLARMHGHHIIQRQTAGRLLHLLHHDEGFYRRWICRARGFLSPNQGIDWLAGRYDRVIERLTSIPRGFIHGEFYPSNVLLRESGGPLQICPIDWEMAAIGPWLIDLAALSMGKWSDGERKRITLAYWNEIQTSKETLPPVNTFLEWVEYCRLHLCIQWLGWAPNWSPPREHVHDWLGEAMLLAEKLRL